MDDRLRLRLERIPRHRAEVVEYAGGAVLVPAHPRREPPPDVAAARHRREVIELIEQANPYQSVERALKYAPLFIGLVFLTYFLFEAGSGVRAHPAQYVLVGLAQTVFYMLLLSISENGYGKRTPIGTYRLTSRGGKGVINMKTTNKTGQVIGVLLVREDSDVMIVSQNGKIIRIESGTIRQSGRSAQGVRLVNLEADDKVGSIARVDAEQAPAETP